MKSRIVDLGGPVHFADFGGSGPPVVLVHGLGSSHASWIPVGPALAEGRRVVAIDLLGFGRTPPEGRSTDVHSSAAMLVRFLESEVREPAVLVGNSMGGLVSLLAAERSPRAVSGVVLVGPALPRPWNVRGDRVVNALFMTYMLPGIGELFLRRRMARLGPEKVLRDTLRLCGVDPDRVQPDAWEASVALARERRGFPWANAAFLAAARSLVRTNFRPTRVYDIIRKLRAPGLLVQGSADRLVPLAATQAVARLRPDWRLEVLDGVGHVPQLEVPRRWLEVVTPWLDRAIASA